MKIPFLSFRQHGRPSRGFALIVTLSLMILLTIIAVGLLTLSSISLRSSTGSLDLARARSNARMALVLAIGDLQKQAGSDTRVTARADVLDVNHPPVLGVWKSWEGIDHDKSGASAGRPVSPGNYASAKQSRFIGWLTSIQTPAASPAYTPPDTSKSTGKATLVGEGSVGSGGLRDKLQIHLTPSILQKDAKVTGAFAWWVGGENQKARLPKPYDPTADSVPGWAVNMKSHQVADPDVYRMDTLLTDPSPADKAISLHQADLFTTKKDNLTVSSEFFHDLSAVSTGLLTNTATGGWRKDLSLLTENWTLLPASNLPFFRVEPGKDIAFNMPKSGNHRPSTSLLYPWAAYRGSGNIPIYEHGAVSSWENLKDWATLYKSMPSSTTVTSLPNSPPRSYPIDSNTSDQKFNFLHRTRAIPVIARVQWVFSHSAARVGTLFEPRLLVTPVVTLWNPYNVTLTSSPLTFRLVGCLPNAFRFSVNSVPNTKWNSITSSSNYSPALAGVGAVNFRINTGHTLKPGETLLFSPASAAPAPHTTDLELTPGFRKQGGHYFNLRKDDGTVLTGLPNTASIKAEVKFDASFLDVSPQPGVGIYLDMSIGGARHLVYRMIYEPAVATAVYRPISDLAPATLAQSVADPQPFLTTIFGARTASRTHLAAKGFVQTSPLVNYTAMGSKDTAESTIQWDYPGTAHPVNSPFDYSFEPLAGAGDSVMPGTDSANRGFIVTGFQSADGLSRCVISELPTRPIQSLAELQNWDLRYENPIPPYSYNIIGNSDATPLIPSNAVFNSFNASKGGQDLQHDDSYCANHILFDDWFVSSLAPNSTSIGRPGSSETLKKTFTDFVSAKIPLPNRAYRPILDDVGKAQTSGGADGLFNTHANKADSWRSIASRIEVEGMFNVNSTSVTAWRALLGHARGQRVPYQTSASATLSAKQDHAFSRFSVAGDTEAKTRGSSGGFSSCAEFAGYRILDDPILDRFAEEIVKQVRARGPFLSLAEFVNRQLATGDTALAGTIQAALNALERDAATNPYAVIQSGSKPSSGNPPSAASAGYMYPDAAVGYNAYGLPGWTRQADVLRPIAPILSARDDTFVIRAYGDARDPTGKIITARATCEAIVRRVRDYVDPADAAEVTTLPRSAANLVFGRRLEVVSFRWLSDQEV